MPRDTDSGLPTEQIRLIVSRLKGRFYDDACVDSSGLLHALGRRVRALREARGWSQEDLARKSDRHFTYIGRIERGEQNVTVEVLLEIAGGLETTLQELLASEPHPLLIKWGVSASDIVEAVSRGFRAQVDVKGKLAELMLYRNLRSALSTGSLESIEWPDEDGKPDFVLKTRTGNVIVECKNVRSLGPKSLPNSPIKVELQKTRDSRDGAPTRGYGIGHFDVLSACLFNRTQQWRFLHIACRHLMPRPNDPKRLVIMQTVPGEPSGHWRGEVMEAISDLEK
jgi:transcriptional regulator with XRE-family HTH domain